MQSGPLVHAWNQFQKQSLAPFEVIVVDDASADQTTEVVKGALRNFRPKITTKILCHTANQGPGAARNWENELPPAILLQLLIAMITGYRNICREISW